MLRKPNKLDYIIAKYYRIIYLLNYLEKIVEKIIIEILFKLCEWQELLYNDQFGSQKRQEAINAIIKLIAAIEQTWKRKKIVNAFFLNIKEAFSNVIR